MVQYSLSMVKHGRTLYNMVEHGKSGQHMVKKLAKKVNDVDRAFLTSLVKTCFTMFYYVCHVVDQMFYHYLPCLTMFYYVLPCSTIFYHVLPVVLCYNIVNHGQTW